MRSMLARAVLAVALLLPVSVEAKPKEEQWKEAEADQAATTTMISPSGYPKEVPDDQVATHKLAGYRIETKAEYEARILPDASVQAGSERVNVITPEGEVASVERKDLEAAKAAGFVEEKPYQAADRYYREAQEQDWSPSTEEVIGIVFGFVLLIIIAYSFMTSNNKNRRS